MVGVPVEDDAALGLACQAVCRQFAHHEHALHSCTRACQGMHQIDPSVLVPQRAGVDKAFPGFHQHRLFPLQRKCLYRPARCLAAHAVHTAVGVAVVDIEPPLVEADARCPYAATVLGAVACSLLGARHTPSQRCIYEAPMHQVPRVQNLQTRDAVEGRRGHVVILPRLTHVRVGVVVRQHRVGVRPCM